MVLIKMSNSCTGYTEILNINFEDAYVMDRVVIMFIVRVLMHKFLCIPVIRECILRSTTTNFELRAEIYSVSEISLSSSISVLH